MAAPKKGCLERRTWRFTSGSTNGCGRELEEAFTESTLPDAPKGAAALNQLLVRIRLAGRAKE